MQSALTVFEPSQIAAHLQTISLTDLANATNVPTRTWMNYRSGHSNIENMPIRMVTALNGYIAREQFIHHVGNHILPHHLFTTLRERSQTSAHHPLDIVTMEYYLTYGPSTYDPETGIRVKDQRYFFVDEAIFNQMTALGYNLDLDMATGLLRGVSFIIDESFVALLELASGTEKQQLAEVIRANCRELPYLANDLFALPTFAKQPLDELSLDITDKFTSIFVRSYWTATLQTSSIKTNRLYAELLDSASFGVLHQLVSVRLGHKPKEQLNDILLPMYDALIQSEHEAFQTGGDAK